MGVFITAAFAFLAIQSCYSAAVEVVPTAPAAASGGSEDVKTAGVKAVDESTPAGEVVHLPAVSASHAAEAVAAVSGAPAEASDVTQGPRVVAADVTHAPVV